MNKLTPLLNRCHIQAPLRGSLLEKAYYPKWGAYSSKQLKIIREVQQTTIEHAIVPQM